MIRKKLAQWLDGGLRGLIRNAGALIVNNAMQSCIGLVVVASAIALAEGRFGADFFGLDAESRAVAQLASLVTLANIIGTPTALLRIFNRHRMFIASYTWQGRAQRVLA